VIVIQKLQLNLLPDELRDPHEVALFGHGWTTGHHKEDSYATEDGAVVLGIHSTESLIPLLQVSYQSRILG